MIKLKKTPLEEARDKYYRFTCERTYWQFTAPDAITGYIRELENEIKKLNQT